MTTLVPRPAAPRRGHRCGAAVTTGVLAAAGSSLACSDSPGVDCAPIAEGLTVVTSSGAGLWAETGREARLSELWRVGTAPGEDLAFPIGIAPGPGGRIAVPDFSLGEVVVIEPDGTWTGTATRAGEGPGEVRTPIAATWDAAGRLVAFDIIGAKVVFLDGETNAAREDLPVTASLTSPVVESGGLQGALVLPDGTTFVLPGPSGDRAAAGSTPVESVLLRAAPGAAAADTVLRVVVQGVAPEGFDWVVPRGAHRALAAAGPDGTLVIGSATGEYAVHIENGTSGERLQLCRATEPLPLSAIERGDSVQAGSDPLVEAVASLPAVEPAAYGRLIAGRNGVVWVQRERASVLSPRGNEGLHGVPGASYDVFDGSGEFLGTLQAPSDVHIQAIAGDTVWAFAFDSLNVPSVVAYRLELVDVEG